jgi:hypothetical protein
MPDELTMADDLESTKLALDRMRIEHEMRMEESRLAFEREKWLASRQDKPAKDFSPTTSLSCANQICPRRIAVSRLQATRESGLGYTRKSLC